MGEVGGWVGWMTISAGICSRVRVPIPGFIHDSVDDRNEADSKVLHNRLVTCSNLRINSDYTVAVPLKNLSLVVLRQYHGTEPSPTPGWMDAP